MTQPYRSIGLVTALMAGLAAIPAQAQEAALVEDVRNAPNAGIEAFDPAYVDQVIDLGGKGRTTLSYFTSCQVDDIRGGTVTVGLEGSEVTGGSVKSAEQPCQGPTQVVALDAKEAGTGAIRVFPTMDWQEKVVKTNKPHFSWKPGLGEVTVTLFEMDHQSPLQIWSGSTGKSNMPYPKGAGNLKSYAPYGIIVTASNGQKFEAYFSRDPELDVKNTKRDQTVLAVPTGPDPSDSSGSERKSGIDPTTGFPYR
ncbi:MAG: hypothetical protein ACPGO3_02130 [Magnetospiraceae bacterium]